MGPEGRQYSGNVHRRIGSGGLVVNVVFTSRGDLPVSVFRRRGRVQRRVRGRRRGPPLLFSRWKGDVLMKHSFNQTRPCPPWLRKRTLRPDFYRTPLRVVFRGSNQSVGLPWPLERVWMPTLFSKPSHTHLKHNLTPRLNLFSIPLMPQVLEFDLRSSGAGRALLVTSPTNVFDDGEVRTSALEARP